ncbi:hypothetical protein [Paraburkholderia flava]|uniref:hypothetical protein n=1 Tax=Paraburkholderia flava TaxID=2547393 RepID=UPI00105DFFFF|nr:hypothetical protein [Paraburkholderia flava]
MATFIGRWSIGMALAAALGTLAACGGSSGGNGGATRTNATPPVTSTPVSKTLVVELDGLTYSALTKGIASGTLPNLAKLTVAPAYSGGIVNTLGQQPNLDTPGWASLVTGTWANRHQVNSDAPGQALHADTLFKTLRAANGGKAGVAASSSGLAALLAPDRNAGYLDAVTNCANVDSCVTQNALTWIDGGYSLVFAQYHSAQDAALNTGFSTDYSNTLAQLDAALGTLRAETAKRSGENWLVVVTASHGLNAAGGADGLPLLNEATSFVALSQTANALASDSSAPTTLAALYPRASIADIAPTVLANQGALPTPASYVMDGGPLVGATPVSQLNGVTGADHLSVVLTWNAPASGAITVLRDGATIATLPAGTATYTDSNLGVTVSGAYQFNYTVVAGGTPASTIAQANYVAPPPPPPPPPTLATTLTNGLSSYYPFGTLPPVDRMSASTMAPWAADADGGSLTTVADPFGGKGLQVDTNIVDTNGFDGYKLTQTNDVTKQPQFTLGTWFMTSCTNATSNGTPILSNKNYFTGKNAGLAFGLFPGSGGTCNVRFNIGDGSVRNDVTNLNVTANRWVYLALTVDTVAKTMNTYIFDPVLGEQKSLGVAMTIDVTKLPGLGVFGLNEDGTGRYFMNSCSDSPPYTVGQCGASPPDVQSFADLAMWTRVLTETELQSIFGSGKPLSTLIH